MFVIEYRTISRVGISYPIRVATVGPHKAISAEEAAAHILRTTQNVEIISATYRPIGA